MPRARKTPRPTGRPSKLTPQLQADLVRLLKRGHYQEAAAAYVGISKATYYAWMERGHAARVLRDQGRTVPAREKPFLEFVDEIELARGYGEAWLMEQALDAINNPKNTRWQGFVTILERRHRERWARGPREEKPATPPPSRLDFSKLDAQQREQLKTLLRSVVPDEG